MAESDTVKVKVFVDGAEHVISVDPEIADYKKFIATMAKEHCVGVPGFETPGPGNGVMQRSIKEEDTIVWSHSVDSVYYPLTVTYKYIQGYVRRDNKEVMVQQFYDLCFRESVKHYWNMFEFCTRFMAWVGRFESDEAFERFVLNALNSAEEAIPKVVEELEQVTTEEMDSTVVEYTYNYPDDFYLTQDIEWIGSKKWKESDSMWLAVIFHTGVDARCGFTGPVFLKVSADTFMWGDAWPYVNYEFRFPDEETAKRVYNVLKSYDACLDGSTIFLPFDDPYDGRDAIEYLLELSDAHPEGKSEYGYASYVYWTLKPLEEMKEIVEQHKGTTVEGNLKKIVDVVALTGG